MGVGRYIFLIGGIMVLLQIAGFDLPVSSIVSNFVENFQDFKLSNFFAVASVIVGALAVTAGITLGIISPSRFQFVVMTGYIVILLGFVTDIIALNIRLAQNEAWIGIVSNLIFIPLGVFYTHAVMSWWFGRTEE